MSKEPRALIVSNWYSERYMAQAGVADALCSLQAEVTTLFLNRPQYTAVDRDANTGDLITAYDAPDESLSVWRNVGAAGISLLVDIGWSSTTGDPTTRLEVDEAGLIKEATCKAGRRRKGVPVEGIVNFISSITRAVIFEQSTEG